MIRLFLAVVLLFAQSASAGVCLNQYKALYESRLDNSIVDKVENASILLPFGAAGAGLAVLAAGPAAVFGVGSLALFGPFFVADAIDNARERSALRLVDMIKESQAIVSGKTPEETPALDRLSRKIKRRTGSKPDREILAERIVQGDLDGSLCVNAKSLRGIAIELSREK